MKFSENWLRQWVNPPISREALLAQLTQAGLEVDSAEPVSGAFEKVVIAEILSVSPHPKADRLRVCQVNIGQPDPIVIVTNAASVQPGLKVPAVLVGGRVPGLSIQPTELRGVASYGMFCSAKTLGIGEDDADLWYLPSDFPVGQDLKEFLALDDVSIDLELTPNRSDCLSLAGIAREIGALNQLPVCGPEIKPVPATLSEVVEVEVEQPAACPRYLARIVKRVNPAATTPTWMAERLRRSGIRCIHPIVDVTNYVMLELGQPLHAFDANKVGSTLRIGWSEKAEESIELLDGKTYTIQPTTLVVKNAHGESLALIGIMGGASTAISRETTDIILESAFFAPQSLAGKAREYGLHTDASHRFERGVDPELPRLAMERATALILDIVGGEAGPCVEKVSPAHLPMIPTITFRKARIERVLRMAIPDEKVVAYLTALGMRVTATSEGWEVVPPSFRFDIQQEIDLIEEVARLYGYNQLPSGLPTLPLSMLPQSKQKQPVAVYRDQLKLRGYHEIISYSFVSPDLQNLLEPSVAVAVDNPISSEMRVMRTTLWTGLLSTLISNQKRQQARVRLFEIGLRFYEQDGHFIQTPTLAGLVYGSLLPEQWGESARSVDFYDLKADVEQLLAGQPIQFKPTKHPALHPGQSAAVYLHEEKIGLLGALHPQIAQELALQETYLFELDLEKIQRLPAFHYQAPSRFPAIRRDLALLVDQGLPAWALQNAITTSAGELLEKVFLFDVYQGKGIPSGQKSVALGLFLQAPDRTLTDEEVNTVIERVLSHLKQTFSATLRE